MTGEYVLQQVALKTDHMDVQTRLAKSEYEVLTLTNLLSSQKEQLNHLLGRDVTTDFSVTDGMEIAQVAMRETDLVQARERAMTQRPEIREATLRIQQSKLDRRAKKTEFIPDVSLTLNYISTFNYSNFVPRNITGLGVQIDWEVFDWGRKKREIDEKDRTISQAENNLKDTQSRVLINVPNLKQPLHRSRQIGNRRLHDAARSTEWCCRIRQLAVHSGRVLRDKRSDTEV